MNPTGASGRALPPGFNGNSLPLEAVQLFVKSHQKQGILPFDVVPCIPRWGWGGAGSAQSLQKCF